MPTVLYLSPHLDDVAFSASRHLVRHARSGDRCVVATVFTRSVPDPVGFALRCQTDKGIDPSADYLAIRRDEDRTYVDRLNQAFAPERPVEAIHGDLPEAPHRGYESPPALFGPPAADDDIGPAVDDLLRSWIDRYAVDRIIAPAGYGNHIDHRRVIDALPTDVPTAFYRDSPYVHRVPNAKPYVDAGRVCETERLPPDPTIDGPIADAVASYATQLPFQYGGEPEMRTAMTTQSQWIDSTETTA